MTITRTSVTRSIAASPDRVFAAVSEVENLPNVVPDVVGVEVLSPASTGVGTRFVETRLMRGKETKTELEVTEFVPSERVRMVTDSHGTVWDTVFTVQQQGERTELGLTMDARAHELLPRILNPIMKGLIKKGLEKHVDAVQAYCEAGR